MVLMTIKNTVLTFWLVGVVIMSICAGAAARMVCPMHKNCVLSMSLDMLLQILRPLEGFAAEFAPMGF